MKENNDMYSKTQLVTVNDFSGFYDFPLRFQYEKLDNAILITQNQKLRQILTKDLYNSLISLFEFRLSIDSILVGSTTQITVLDTSILSLYKYIKIIDSRGLFQTPSIDTQTNKVVRISEEENRFYEFTIIDPATISIDYDSTGQTVTENGFLGIALDQDFYNLFEYILPFLCFGSLPQFLLGANRLMTKSGSVQKQTGESNQTSDKNIANEVLKYEQNMEFYQNQLRQFLDDNTEIYTDYNPEVVAKTKGRNIGVYASKENILNRYWKG